MPDGERLHRPGSPTVRTRAYLCGVRGRRRLSRSPESVLQRGRGSLPRRGVAQMRTKLAAAAVCPAIAVLAAPARAFADAEPTSELAAHRAKLAIYHRSMGITTWISLAATTTLGTIRYANVIGFGEPLCAEGRSPIFG